MLTRVSPAYLLGFAGFVLFPLSVFAPILVSTLFAVTAAAAMVLAVAARRLPGELPWVYLGLFSALVAWGAASAAWSIDAEHSLHQAVKLLAFGIGGFALVATAHGLSPAGRTRVLRALAYGVVLGLGLLAIEIVSEGALIRLGRSLFAQNEAFIFSVAYNRAAAVLAVVLWPALLFFWRRGPRVAGLAAFLGAGVLLLSLENLAATVAFAGGVLVFAAALRFGSRLAIPFAAVIALGALLAPLAPSTVLAPKAVAAWLPSLSGAQFHRVLIWDFAADRIAERPLTGWGLNASRRIPGGRTAVDRAVQARTSQQEIESGEQTGLRAHHDRPADAGPAWEQLPMHPHNAILQWWLELGLPGAALGAGLVVALLLGVRRHLSDPLEQATALAVIFAATTISLLSYSVWQSWWLATLWLAAMLATAAMGGRPSLAAR